MSGGANEDAVTAERPVVVGTDGSPPAGGAVAWAADEAADLGRPLHVVYAADPIAYGVPFVPPSKDGSSLLTSGEGVVSAARRLALERRPRVRVTTEVADAAPVDAFRELSRTAALTVLGSRGLGGFTGMLLGSVGRRVAGQADGPVVVVRGDGTRREFGEIAVGVDLSDASEAALEHAFATARRRGAKVRVVHAFQLEPALVQARYLEDERETERTVTDRVRAEYARLRDVHPDVQVIEALVRDHPVRALTAASEQADLVVVAARGRGALAGALLGSVSHGVLHHAHCPVAVVRPDEP
ncbi:universal stress protein [Actinomadura parmotrematis]|uniref:Universal stress protein n=1 Tax=Actinomadura parmotrematis TaxID=2864039 RepID=A0ABS7FLZ4_9ACTN|nr:universal stress protein [Actinomadura parmotrematis]MBW8481376.1 universal stress protein [Actinomadura parmotrematis]